jgi:hypothetical protein
MVNGTWARNAPWIQANSKISQHLRDRLPGEVCICPCPWPGNNRHGARLEAAQQLQERIKNIRDKYADQGEEIDHFVVAHSHGGNVALLACKDPEVERALTGVICMATPFLYFRRSTSASGLTALGVLFWVLIIVLLLAGTLMTHLNELGLTVPEWVYGVSITLLLSGFVIWVTRLTEAQDRLDLLERLSLPTLDRDKLLLIRSVGDEATGALAGTAMATWLTVFLYSLPYRIIEAAGHKILGSTRAIVMIAAAAAALVGVGYVWWDHPRFIAWSDQMKYWQALLGFFVFILPPVVLVAIRFLLTMSSGYDIPFKYSQFMVTAEPVPTSGTYTVNMIRARSDTVRNVDEVRWSPEPDSSSWEALKHSEVYEHPKALACIAEWVTGRKREMEDAA